MADLFYSARLTLARAEHHIKDFDTLVRDFVNDKPWLYFVDNKSELGTDIYKIQFTRQLPEMLPCILFDAVNNLRSVLDQAGYASAIAAKSPRLKAIKFPFSACKDEFANHVAGACKDLPTEIRSLFETFKAYKGGNDILWGLNEIANAKKHFALIPLCIGQGWATIYTDGDGGQGYYTGPDIGWDASRNEMVLMKSSPSQSKLSVSGHFTFSVAISGIEVLVGRQATHVLNEMRGAVQDVLMRTEGECRRLGFKLD